MTPSPSNADIPYMEAPKLPCEASLDDGHGDVVSGVEVRQVLVQFEKLHQSSHDGAGGVGEGGVGVPPAGVEGDPVVHLEGVGTDHADMVDPPPYQQSLISVLIFLGQP